MHRLKFAVIRKLQYTKNILILASRQKYAAHLYVIQLHIITMLIINSIQFNSINQENVTLATKFQITSTSECKIPKTSVLSKCLPLDHRPASNTNSNFKLQTMSNGLNRSASRITYTRLSFHKAITSAIYSPVWGFSEGGGSPYVYR
jgi:hypothetical protein